MKIEQLSLKTLNADKLSQLAAIHPQLILVFGDVSFFAPPSTLAETLTQLFPTALRLGCSTAGEIAGAAIEEKSLVVTAIHFEHTQVHAVGETLIRMEDSAQTGQAIAKHLPHDSKAVMVLGPGININGSGLIEGIYQVLDKNIPLTGGLAGDGGAFNTTYTLLNETISDRQVVALGLSGEHLHFYHGSFGGWQPFGPARKVTRCKDNILYELDDEPAISVYKHYLGEHAKGLPGTSLLFPFAILDEAHQETGLIRTILGIDEAEGALILAGDIHANSYLKLMHASTDRLVEGAEQAAEAVMKMCSTTPSQQGLGILISCVGRKLVMGDRVDEELEAVAEVLPAHTVLTGFYSYGEISPYQTVTDCRLHNQTMTITYLSEI